jgi:hypothetical protein
MFGRSRAVFAASGFYRIHESGNGNGLARIRRVRKSVGGEHRQIGVSGILITMLRAVSNVAKAPNHPQNL